MQKTKQKLQEENWREENADWLSEYRSAYYQENKEALKEKSQQYRKNNADKVRKCNAKYRDKNREAVNKKKMEYYKTHKNDILLKVANNIRARLRRAISNNQKVGSAVKDLGCSIQKLKEHLESKFTEGMTWESYGLYGWHIDHKIPLASFNLMDKEEFLKACHYSNLQPLWASDNYEKSNKI